MTTRSRGRTIGWTLAMTLAVATATAVSGCSKPAPIPTPPLTVVEGEAPVVVKTSARGEVPIGVPTAIVLQVQAAPELQWMSTTVRGVSGVSVSHGEAAEHDVRRGGRTQARTIQVIATSGVHGLVAVDVSWRRPGDNGTMSATLAFPIHAAGAKPSTPPIGRLEKGPDGEPVQVMPSP